jgi:hypothetical protein
MRLWQVRKVKPRTQLALVASALVLIFSVGVVVVPRTDAYEIASDAIKRSPGVQVLAGDVKKISFLPWRGFSYQGGALWMYVEVEGSKGAVLVYVDIPHRGTTVNLSTADGRRL